MVVTPELLDQAGLSLPETTQRSVSRALRSRTRSRWTRSDLTFGPTAKVVITIATIGAACGIVALGAAIPLVGWAIVGFPTVLSAGLFLRAVWAEGESGGES